MANARDRTPGARAGTSGGLLRRRRLITSKKHRTSVAGLTNTRARRSCMRRVVLAEQFEELLKQGHAARLGMWAFLASEVMLFSGFFALYAAYRIMYGHDFVEAIRHNTLWHGSINTLVLITSSLTVALSIHAMRANLHRT